MNILNSLELNSTNVINEQERGGTARSLFWPWAAANVSLLALGYGGLFLDLFNISFWQAVVAAVGLLPYLKKPLPIRKPWCMN